MTQLQNDIALLYAPFATLSSEMASKYGALSVLSFIKQQQMNMNLATFHYVGCTYRGSS